MISKIQSQTRGRPDCRPVFVGALVAATIWALVPRLADAQGVNMLANDALKALLGKDMPMDGAAANATGAQVMMTEVPGASVSIAADGARQRYTVNKGETLDRVIARSMTGIRADIKLIRKAFVMLNPAAFPRGTPHIMIAGANLQVPTAGDLQALSGGRTLSAQAPAENMMPSEPVDKRGWVRFP
jgi:Tfp pilus assembly protein FimV